MTWGDATARTVVNARTQLIDYLNAQMSEPVGSWYPTEANPEAPSLPYVSVANDGSPTSDEVHMFTTLRITAWAANPSPAFTLAATARGKALAWSSATVDGVRRGIGISESVDDRTGHNLASCTVIAAARVQ